MALGQLFDELKRRNVFRVAVAYLVSAWLVLQVADVILNNISAPDWVFSAFMLLGAVCFVPVLVFSWAYELTPEGLKKEHEVDRSKSITRETGRKLDYITIAMLVAVVAFVIVERTILERPTEPVALTEVADTEVQTTVVDDKSIAVLAFDDLSPEGDQAFFAEGLSEEILNVLAQNPSLKVAGRTSSFAFRGKDTDLREIAEVLNVAHVLEGSVRKAGDRIRVTAQLIQASDGFHLFSRTYDRDLTDVFAVQDDLAALIGEALQAQLTGGQQAPTVAETSIEAYDLYLLARQRIRTRNVELMKEAMAMLDDALTIDPDYAPALAQRALVVNLLSDDEGAYGDIPAAIAEVEALGLLDRALAIDPRLPEAHAIKGLVMTDQSTINEEAVASLRYALELNPNMDDGKNWLANATPDFFESLDLYEQVVVRDPMYGPAFNNLIQLYLGMSQFDKAEALIDRVERIGGSDENISQARGTVAAMRGDLSLSARELQFAFDANPNSSIVALWYGFAMLQLGELESALVEASPNAPLMAHWFSGDFESADEWIEAADFGAGNRALKLSSVIGYLTSRGRAAEAIEIVERHFGGLTALIETIPVDGFYGTAYLGPLAYAYLLEDGQDEYRTLVAEMQSVFAVQEARKGYNWIFWVSRAQHAALVGDAAAATDYMQRAYESGLTSVIPPNTLFDLLDEHEPFQGVLARIVERGNRERAELGLEPYVPALEL